MTDFQKQLCRWWCLLLVLVPASLQAATLALTNLFGGDEPLRLEFQLSSASIESLRKNSRGDVTATVIEGGSVYTNVALHLKGAGGSSRSIDDKPSFTLDFGRGPGIRLFHGLRKLSFNNSVEDPSYMHETIGSEMFHAAGLPAPRVGHAVLSLNGRSLGLFVAKEGFTEELMARFFRSPRGALYEPGPGHDVNQRLQRRLGDGPDDQADLKAVADAALDPDLPARAKALGKVLDLDRFLSFMAMEILIGHRDGYCLARNNFRLYADPSSGRFTFLPQGMNQLFGNPSAPWRPEMSGLLARSFLELPDGRKRYRERFSQLLTNVMDAGRLSNHVGLIASRIRPVMSQSGQASFGAEIDSLQQRIALRRQELDAQLSLPDLEPLNFTGQEGLIPDNWRPFDLPENGRLDRVNQEGQATLHIVAGPRTAASWRCRILVGPGNYQLLAKAKTIGVEPLGFGRRHGATVRIAEQSGALSESLIGTHHWQGLTAPFSVQDREREIELICELRASRGEVWFDMKFLKLVRLPP